MYCGPCGISLSEVPGTGSTVTSVSCGGTDGLGRIDGLDGRDGWEPLPSPILMSEPM